MTRLIHDKFAKDYLEELLKNYGTITANLNVKSEKGEIDIFFEPASKKSEELAILGLLGRMAQTTAIFEPFRNPVTANQIGDCLVKSLLIRQELRRKVKREQSKIEESAIPRLWILTPTASDKIINQFTDSEGLQWLPGIYFLKAYFKTAIIVIHQLPRTTETLWLRVLGRGTVQETAITELEQLPEDNPFREMGLKLLYNLQQNLKKTQENLEEEEQELIMRLAPLYERDKEQAIQQERRNLIENLLIARFGELDDSLKAIIQPLSELPAAEFSSLILELSHLSREELLTRFTTE